MKPRFLLLLLVSLFLSCQSTSLPEEEQALVGAWKFEVNPSANGNRNYKYLELDENKKGINGMLVEMKDRSVLAMPFNITQWKISGDTLIIKYVMNGGIFSVPGQPERAIKDHTETDYWIIKEKSEKEFVAIMYEPGLPPQSAARFIRIHDTSGIEGRSK